MSLQKIEWNQTVSSETRGGRKGEFPRDFNQGHFGHFC